MNTEQESKEGIFSKLLSIIKSETSLPVSSHFQRDSFAFSERMPNSAKSPKSCPLQVHTCISHMLHILWK